jgi:WD40 repeat protein/serine/threonine protein kinase
VLEELGKGGMGVVYKARQIGLGRLVALKMISGGPSADSEVLARFRQEAEAIARLHHPNIIQVHEIGVCPAGPYFVMELAYGGNLADLWGGRPQPPRAAATLLTILARAVHAAHQAGIVHRDLKPGNVLLQLPHPPTPSPKQGEGEQDKRPGEATPLAPTRAIPAPPLPAWERGLGGEGGAPIPKISDFGLARRVDDPRALTQDGQVMGTPGYMAPEQALGPAGNIGPAADIYAIGVLLYEALTGGPPHRGTSALETVHLMLSEEPVPPSRLRARVPPDLETICLHCLHREPARRYASAADLADDLERWLRGEPIKARPTPAWERAWKWARRRPSMAALTASTVFVTLLALILVTWQWRRAEAEQQRTEEQRGRAVRIAEAEAQARREAERLSRQLLLERGTSLCENGDPATGLLWLARALAATPPEDQAATDSLRRLLAGWGQRLHPLRHHWRPGGRMRAALFSPDGRTVWAATDKQLFRWDVSSGEAVGPPAVRRDKVLALVSGPGGPIVVAQEDHTIRLSDLATGKPLGQPLRHEAPVRCVVLSRDASVALTGSDDGKARLWDLRSGRARAIGQHEGAVRAVALSPDGARALTGGNDKTARLWDVVSGRLLATMREHTGSVLCVGFSPNGRTIVTGGNDRRALVRNRNGTVQARLRHPHQVYLLAFTPDSAVLATGCHDDMVRLWTIADGEPLGPALRHHDDVNAITFSPDGRSLLTAGDDGTVRLREVGQPASEASWPHPQAVISLTVSRDGRYVLTGCADNQVRLWETGTGKDRTIPGKTAPMAVAFRPDGERFAVGFWDAKVRLYETATGKPIGKPLPHKAPVRAVALSPDGTKLLSGCDDKDKVLRLWDLASAKVERTFVGHRRKIMGVAISPDGKLGASASWDYEAQLWDLTTGKAVGEPLRHQDLVQAIVFSPDGKTVATCGDDYTTRLWDVPTGLPRGLPLRHAEKARAVAFSPDGRVLATGMRSRGAQLWDVHTGKALGPLLPHDREVYSLAFRPDGRLLTGSWDRALRLWRVPAPLSADVADIQQALQVHTGLRLDQGGAAIALDLETWCAQARRLRLGRGRK